MMRILRIAVPAVCMAWLFAVPAAQADFSEYEIESLSASLSSSQAGAHADFRTVLTIKTALAGGETAQTRDVIARLPPGLLGDISKFPRCTMEELGLVECAMSTQVGMIAATLLGGNAAFWPIYNVVPPAGSDVVARFGFFASFFPVTIDVRVDPADEYAASADLEGIAPAVALRAATTTIWGVPGSPVHDAERMSEREGLAEKPTEPHPSPLPPTPFLSNPTRCGVPLEVAFSADSYQLPGLFSTKTASLGALTGCEQISFAPQLTATPTSAEAGAPTGLDVDIKLPQDEAAEGLATADLRDSTVTLPEGMTIAAGSADGLGSCDATQAAYEEHGPAHCPESSKIGSVELDAVGLEHPLHGGVYLRTPQAGDLFRIWIVADELGVHVALPGEIAVNKQTGQITTTFAETPQVPTREIKLQLFGGPRAPLANPDQCGTYQTSWQMTPWTGGTPATGQSPMSIDAGCGGTGAFAPQLKLGATDASAGGFAPLAAEFTRNTAEQNIERLDLTLPPGLMADLSGVPLCDAAVAAGTGECPAASRIGAVTVAVGPGSNPLWVPQPGKAPTAVYLTGPYEGAPFGLAVKVPAQAGPFDLGTVTTMVALHIDPHTAQVHADSDPLPQIIEGVPITYRTLRVLLDRPGFTFNPTSCGPMSSVATVTSNQGQAATASDPFQADRCDRLAFKPGFTVSTSAKTSKADGASLKVKVVPPAEGPQNSSNGSSGSSAATKPEEANIKSVKVELPRQLPSRLTTLQKACTAQQFDSNPAGCPSASLVGTAIAWTPILNNPLTGPAYFVSHGNEAFPQLIVVLQGENGLVVDLVGDTFISKAGITSSTFASVPDVPVSSFELTLPEGPHSALAANVPLCAQPLSMPTEFTGQNGAQIKQSTPMEVEGCSNALSFVSHKIKKRTLTVSVSVPAAGKLTASGKGLSKTSKTAKGRETLKLTLHQLKAGKLKTKVKVVFTPSTGKDRKKLSKSLSVKFKK
jgi:hypothetical protein